MNEHQLGVYTDLIEEAQRQGALYPPAMPGPATQRRVREVLGWCDRPESARDVRVERTWEKDGLRDEEIGWSVGPAGPAR